MSYIMSLDVSDVIALLDTAFEKREEEKAWDMWVARYPHMTKENFIPFSDFFKKARMKNVSQRPAEEILQEVYEIRKKAQKNSTE